jgi:hypothetical protein
MQENGRSWFVRMTGFLAILAILLAVGNFVLGFAAVGFTPPPDTFSSVSVSLPIDGIDADLLRWSTICDLFGYYLLLAPLALDASGTILVVPAIFAIGLGGVLLIPVWNLASGISLLRRPGL